MADGRRTKLLEYGLIVLVVALLPLLWAYTPVLSWLWAFLAWVRDAGALGVFSFILIFAISGALLLSSELMMAASGFVFGPVAGAFIAWLGELSAFALNMVLARTILRDRLNRRWQERGSPIGALDERMATRGLFISFLLRLPPLSPYHLVSYALGVSKVGVRDAFLGSMVGGIPQVVIFSWIGSTVSNVEDLSHTSSDVSPAFWAALVGTTVGVTALLTWIARRELKKLAVEGA